MQIPEYSVFGLRSARLDYYNAEKDIALSLFPVIHVAEPAFFAQVYEEAYSSDRILTEGVNTPTTRRLTRAYRYMPTRRNGLVLQTNTDPKSVPAKTRRADLTPEEFTDLWQTHPLSQRILLTVAAPIIGLKNRWFLSKQRLAKMLEMDDLTARKTNLSWTPAFAEFENTLLHARDARLISVLNEEVTEAGVGETIAVVYGAAHIPAVISALSSMGFVWRKSTWLSVFKTDR